MSEQLIRLYYVSVVNEKEMKENKAGNIIRVALLKQIRVWCEQLEKIVESSKDESPDNETTKRYDKMLLILNLIDSYSRKYSAAYQSI